ncbi:hypothetical protein B4U78_013555 [Microbacterium esteraromaticum]|nr:hypothetical protein B4U78_013555 [Microbacterium esteraromaticum]
MEWGSLAEWVGAVGTIGALLLGITLFARDRAIARRAGVDALNTWLSWEDVADRDEGFRRLTTVHVCNSGTRPIYAPLLFYPDKRGGYASEIISDDGRPAMLPPGAEMSRVIQGVPRNTVARNVLLRSADGRLWIRKVDEHRYANPLAHIALLLLLLFFERQDGASARRLRQRERQVVPPSSARLALSGLPRCQEGQR